MPVSILVVDDEPDLEVLIRQKFREKIASSEFLFTFAGNGIEALEKLENDESIEIVLTDINMPKMDGYEVIRQLRQNPRHKTTPILVLTTESDADKRNIARSAGATGWMVKPFDPEGLIAIINKVSP